MGSARKIGEGKQNHSVQLVERESPRAKISSWRSAGGIAQDILQRYLDKRAQEDTEALPEDYQEHLG